MDSVSSRGALVLFLLLLGFGLYRCYTEGSGEQGDAGAALAAAENREIDAVTFSRWHPKILGGRSAPEGRFPYACSLRRRWSREHVCGGTLIQPNLVLTAAHCLLNIDGTGIGVDPIVYCGIYNVDTDDDALTFSATANMHAEWTGRVEDGFDIALLELDREANITYLPKLAVSGHRHRYGERLAAIGWGDTGTGSPSQVLRIADNLSYYPHKLCTDVLNETLMEHMICAGLMEQNTCDGDSGGPLIIPDARDGDIKKGKSRWDLIVGITSASVDPDDTTHTCDAEMPGVYTDVSYFQSWIKRITEADSELRKSLREKVVKSVEKTKKYAFLSPERTIQVKKKIPCLDYNGLMQKTMAAFRTDDDETAEAILFAGLDPETTFYDNSTESFMEGGGTTLLHGAAYYDAIRCAKVLVEQGVEIDAKSNKGFTPLHVAALRGSVSVAEMLIAEGADINAVANFDWTPLHCASRYGHVDVAKMLIPEGAVIDAVDSYGRTPLHYASRHDHVNTAKMLIAEGADIGAVDIYGQTPLHLATEYVAVNAAKMLIAEGANVNAVDYDGRTPLHFAAAHGNVDTAKALVNAGASKTAMDDEGKKPIDSACASRSCSATYKKALEELLDPEKERTTPSKEPVVA